MVPPFCILLLLLGVFANGVAAASDVSEGVAVAVLSVFIAFFVVVSVILVLIIIVLKRDLKQRNGTEDDARSKKHRAITRVPTDVGIKGVKSTRSNFDQIPGEANTYPSTTYTPGYEQQTSTDPLISAASTSARPSLAPGYERRTSSDSFMSAASIPTSGFVNPTYVNQISEVPEEPETVVINHNVQLDVDHHLSLKTSPPPDYYLLNGNERCVSVEAASDVSSQPAWMTSPENEKPISLDTLSSEMKLSQQSLQKPPLSPEVENTASKLSSPEHSIEMNLSGQIDGSSVTMATGSPEHQQLSSSPPIVNGETRAAVTNTAATGDSLAPNKNGVTVKPRVSPKPKKKVFMGIHRSQPRRDSQKPLLNNSESSIGDSPPQPRTEQTTANLEEVFNEEEEEEPALTESTNL